MLIRRAMILVCLCQRAAHAPMPGAASSFHHCAGRLGEPGTGKRILLA
jgi:hypothetical protein